ncbi:MAG: zinc transporter ZntB [Kiloniellales bacterium]|nr:zinc transporter ZntB [Kiloniellales bacterium]
MPDGDNGLVCAYALDGQGGGRVLDWPEVEGWEANDGLQWVHLSRRAEGAQRWLEQKSGLDPVVQEALLAEETRPHCDLIGEGVLLILRGINTNPGADPTDMVSIRLWIEAHRVVSSRHRKVSAIRSLQDAIAAERGPHSASDLISDLARALLERMEVVLEELDREIDTLEVVGLKPGGGDHRAMLQQVRRRLISVKRYIAPQRAALTRLIDLRLAWFDTHDVIRLREMSDRVTRYVEDLEALRERAQLMQDELTNRLSEQMNRTMYLLTIVASIFLPLGFITGLLGVNVGGIPGTDEPLGFLALCGLLLVLGLVEYWLFKRLKWI